MIEALPISPELQQKLTHLRQLLQGLHSCVVAFSGGVDSSLLAWLANDVLQEKALALTISSEFDIPGSIQAAETFAATHGIRQQTLKINLLDEPEIRSNPTDRCYFCKRLILSRAREFANDHGFQTVIEGQNVSDEGEYRPGRKAVRESGTLSPLITVGLDKPGIRAISHYLGLETWDAPSSPCLATRFPYHQEITPEQLNQISEAETFLRSLGIRDCRVRVHNKLARIEIPSGEMDLVYQNKKCVVETFSAIGFLYTTLDLAGYRSGSMDQEILAGGENG